MLPSMYGHRKFTYDIKSCGKYRGRLDNRYAVDMSVTFKDTKNARHIRRHFHFLKQGVDQKWHKLVWISIQFMCADVLTKILQKKPLEDMIQWFVNIKCPE